MRRYVSVVELKGNERLSKLIRNNKITIVYEKDYVEASDLDYNFFFQVAYEQLNGLELGDVDIITYGNDGQHWEESLGEIRSVYLAYVKGYEILLSDDHGTKEAAKIISSSKHQIVVKKLEDLLKSNKSSGGSLRWKDIKKYC